MWRCLHHHFSTQAASFYCDCGRDFRDPEMSEEAGAKIHSEAIAEKNTHRGLICGVVEGLILYLIKQNSQISLIVFCEFLIYSGFTPLGRVWLSDEYDFKQSSTWISIRFRVKNLR